MVKNYHYYNMFSPDGTLLQVEYALEAANNSIPISVVQGKNIVVCAYKKQTIELLEEHVPGKVFQVSKNVFVVITGILADIDQIIYKIKDMACSLEYKIGMPVSSDILCRSFADKMQKLIQSTGERALSFNAVFISFDNEDPVMYYTDTSAVVYPYFAVGIGEHYSRINKHLEKKYTKNMTEQETIDLAIESLSESIGAEFNPNDIAVVYFSKDLILRNLSVEQIDTALMRISEMED
ncbi:subunit of proteasome [Hamiltosporidium tvaerminnensis]|uniref:Subunit of proteasome n=2 Tax=Hamiltosporidium TaxID=1176354 RepID=A0A4Q9KUW8_9MICR|nr:subunit of proteasome [Hamiltosporidium magnivora]TBU10392.1 subunit of proteasome [Hamiltosporidium tvaerminnensis]